MKRICSILLCLIMVLCLIPSTVFAEDVAGFWDEGDSVVAMYLEPDYLTSGVDSVTLYYIGESYEIPFTSNSTITFSSSDESVARVDEFGVIIAEGEGEASISMTTATDGVMCWVSVTVVDTTVRGFSFYESPIYVNVGETQQITLVYEGTPEVVSYSSHNTSCASVDQDGVVTGESVGTVTIGVTITNYDGTIYSSSLVVFVEEKTSDEDEENTIKTLTTLYDEDDNGAYEHIEAVYVGDVYQLMIDSFLYLPDAGILTYASSDESTVTVNQDGVITAETVGYALITATTETGEYVSAEITVEEKTSDDGDDTSDTGSSSSTSVSVDTSGLVFSLEVPLNLPISVDSYGVVEVATDCELKNKSGGAVVVSNVSVTPENGWEIVDFDTDFSSKKVGLQEFGMVLNDDEVGTDGSVSLGNGWTTLAANGGTLPIDYEVNVASQATAIELDIATLEFTIEWSESENGSSLEEDTLYLASILEKYDSVVRVFYDTINSYEDNLIYAMELDGIDVISVTAGSLDGEATDLRDTYTYTVVCSYGLATQTIEVNCTFAHN